MTYSELLNLLRLLTVKELSQKVLVVNTDSESDPHLELWGLSKLHIPGDDVGVITLQAKPTSQE